MKYQVLLSLKNKKKNKIKCHLLHLLLACYGLMTFISFVSCLNMFSTKIEIKQLHLLHLTLVLLNPDIPCFANSVDPDQLASDEAN